MSRSRSPRPPRDRAPAPPDPGHACADPGRCTRPFCAAPVDIRLIPPHRARVVVRELPGWPQSASALFDRLTSQITRSQLLQIANQDPFGAHLHFPILVRIRLSGQVPPRLEFEPGEALQLIRWGSGPDVDHLIRAWCCTLMVIAPGYNEELTNIAAQLVDSCLALGGDLPGLAEQLLAWRAVSEAPEDAPLHGTDSRSPDRVAALALLLLRAATAPADTRIDALAQTVADAFTAAEMPSAPWSVSAPLWRHLVDTILTPLRLTQPNLDRLIRTLF